jgi:hypothetical protein
VGMRVENFVGSSPSRFHGTDFLYHSSSGNLERGSNSPPPAPSYCFTASDFLQGFLFFWGPAPITSEVGEELEINTNIKQTMM